MLKFDLKVILPTLTPLKCIYSHRGSNYASGLVMRRLKNIIFFSMKALEDILNVREIPNLVYLK